VCWGCKKNGSRKKKQHKYLTRAAAAALGESQIKKIKAGGACGRPLAKPLQNRFTDSRICTPERFKYFVESFVIELKFFDS